MADSEDTEMDPAIADAMGFSGFGMQKKRKFDANDGFIDPAVSDSQKPSAASGANAVPSGARPRGTSNPTETRSRDGPRAGGEAQSTTNENTSAQAGGAQTSLDDLRNGNVRDSNGRQVIFLPSFIEDPWAGLKPR